MEGVGVGRTGSAYAIPTRERSIYTSLPLTTIARHVADFVRYTHDNPDLFFKVVAIGCGSAGYTPDQIAPMFAGVRENVQLPPEFLL